MQLMPETALRMQVRDAFDPRENIFGGTRYLRVLANMFNGDLELTIAGYNAGEGAVVRYAGIPPYEETQGYVTRVLGYYRRYRHARHGDRLSRQLMDRAWTAPAGPGEGRSRPHRDRATVLDVMQRGARRSALDGPRCYAR